MSIVKIKDKTFRTFIPEDQIAERVKAVAERINKDLADKNPLFLAVLNVLEHEVRISFIRELYINKIALLGLVV